MNESDYKVETVTGSMGPLLQRACKNGTGGRETEVRIEEHNPEFSDFLTWASVFRPDLFLQSTWERGGPPLTFARSVQQVVDYCKQNCLILSVLPYGDAALVTGAVTAEDGARAMIKFATEKVHNDYSYSECRYTRLFEAVQTNGAGDTADNGITARRLPVFVSEKLLMELNNALPDENSEVRQLSSLPVERTFLYVDIVKFSKHVVGRQLVIINSLIRIASDKRLWLAGKDEAHSFTVASFKDREASLCIGDGYIFVFGNAARAAFFAAFLADTIERLIADNRVIDFHFRISINTGLVYRFWDPFHHDLGQIKAGRWNYVGHGITDGERGLAAIGKDKEDIIYMSSETRRKILAEYQSNRNSPYNAIRWLQNRGRQQDKHELMRGFYEVNHMGWMDEIAEKYQEAARIDLWPQC